CSFFDRHLQHFCDVLALVVNGECVAVVPLTVAHLTIDVDVGEEVHLDLDRAVTGARLAAATLDIEAEAARLIAAHLRLWRLTEQCADAVENARVRGRVRARRSTDRRLVYMHHLVEVVEAGHAGVLTGESA